MPNPSANGNAKAKAKAAEARSSSSSSVSVSVSVSISPGGMVCEGAELVGPFPIVIQAGTIIQPRARIFATKGPVVIGSDNIIEEYAVVENLTDEQTLTIGSCNLLQVASVVRGCLGHFNCVEARGFVGQDVRVGNGCVIALATALTRHSCYNFAVNATASLTAAVAAAGKKNAAEVETDAESASSNISDKMAALAMESHDSAAATTTVDISNVNVNVDGNRNENVNVGDNAVFYSLGGKITLGKSQRIANPTGRVCRRDNARGALSSHKRMIRDHLDILRNPLSRSCILNFHKLQH